MKLFLINRLWDNVGYDEYMGFVVRAENKEDALAMCRQISYIEDEVEAIEILAEGEPGIILDSFNAG